MSGITLAQAQAQLDALMLATTSQTLTVRYGERAVTYRSSSEILELINYWERRVAELSRVAGGEYRTSIRTADFRRTQ